MDTLKEGQKSPDVIFLQAALGDLPLTGNFGSKTLSRLVEFQTNAGLTPDGICGTKTWNALREYKPFEKIQDSHYQSEAADLGIEVAALKAVCQVESSGSSLDSSGRPEILFEGHIFWSELKKAGIDPSKISGHSGILYKTWDRSKYLGGVREWERLKEAAGINLESALGSASLGLFQIMGNNWKAAGQKSVQEFYATSWLSGVSQLKAFGAFIKSQGLIKYLQNHDWAGFAKRYNGSGYKANKYDTKLESAYKKLV